MVGGYFRMNRAFAAAGCLLGFLLVAGTGRAQQANARPHSADALGELQFRNLGPAVAGGRVSAVAGVPGDPSVFYVGAAGGGVFKTTDGGISWQYLWDDMPTASIGAIALAPQNPNWVWVATGEGNPRNDVLPGHGIYFSADGGANWKNMGLDNAGQMPVVIVSPADANVVYVASLGHTWAPNPDRGVFRTTDGGKTWQKVLYVNDTTAASDLVMDPQNPKVLYAGMWQETRKPWILESGGDAGGIYRDHRWRRHLEQIDSRSARAAGWPHRIGHRTKQSFAPVCAGGIEKRRTLGIARPWRSLDEGLGRSVDPGAAILLFASLRAARQRGAHLFSLLRHFAFDRWRP